MNRYARRTDDNQAEVVSALRADGWTVYLTHAVGRGFPDLVCGKSGVTVLVEVKRPGEMLTGPEKNFFVDWQGAVVLVFSGEDAVRKCEVFLRGRG